MKTRVIGSSAKAGRKTMTETELLLRRAAYCRDLARRARLQLNDLAGGDAEKEKLVRYLEALEAEALALEKQAAQTNNKQR